MSIQSKEELAALREAGRIVRTALQAMKKQVRAGITTAALNDIGADVLAQNGARSAPALVYGFPADILISVNDEIVHGIPSGRVIRAGDLVKLDVTIEKDGFMADAAITVAVEPIAAQQRPLIECTARAWRKALQVARAGNRINKIGRMVEGEIKKNGFSVVRELCGHGIGRTIHEAPEVPNFYDWRASKRLTDGLVLTIEPMAAAGSGKSVHADDGLTVKTA